MEKFLPEKSMVYKYIIEDKDGNANYLLTKQHFLNATEIASNLGISNRNIIKTVFDSIGRYPKYYYLTYRYKMRIYSPADIFVLIDFLIKYYEESEDGLAICGKRIKLASDSPLREYIFAMEDVA